MNYIVHLVFATDALYELNVSDITLNEWGISNSFAVTIFKSVKDDNRTAS
jgi:hypothetical protein